MRKAENSQLTFALLFILFTVSQQLIEKCFAEAVLKKVFEIFENAFYICLYPPESPKGHFFAAFIYKFDCKLVTVLY